MVVRARLAQGVSLGEDIGSIERIVDNSTTLLADSIPPGEASLALNAFVRTVACASLAVGMTLEALVAIRFIVETLFAIAVAHASIHKICIWDTCRAECVTSSHCVLVACNTHFLRAVVSLALVGGPESLISIGVTCREAGAHTLILITGRACGAPHHAEWCAPI